jgi:hypothetical protein
MKSDALFEKNFLESQVWVQKCADWLTSLGQDVTVKPSTLRPNFKDRHDFVDDGDIEIRLRVEVKHKKKIDFTCEADYPFSTVFTDEVYKIDRLNRKQLYAYIVINRLGTHCAVVLGTSFSEWEKSSVYDSLERDHIMMYSCPKHLCAFMSMEELNETRTD